MTKRQKKPEQERRQVYERRKNNLPQRCGASPFFLTEPHATEYPDKRENRDGVNNEQVLLFESFGRPSLVDRGNQEITEKKRERCNQKRIGKPEDKRERLLTTIRQDNFQIKNNSLLSPVWAVFKTSLFLVVTFVSLQSRARLDVVLKRRWSCQ
ncbi:MAG: hypothetical protein IJL92_06715 [Thermoguttaceae bacterium]|nr:hypothetical protein [Thermoguttaceae bacterium]